MRKHRNYIIIIAATLLFLAILTVMNQREHRWVPTWSKLDKEPYGGKVLHGLMMDLFPGRQISSEYRSLYEIVAEDSSDIPDASLLITANYLSLSDEDCNALIQYIQKGHDALVTASSLGGRLADTLALKVNFYRTGSVTDQVKQDVQGGGYTSLHFSLPGFPQRLFKVDNDAADRYFEEDTVEHMTIAKNEGGYDMIRQYSFGEGHLYVSPDPLLLSNYYLLDTNSRDFSAGMLSLLPADKDVMHIEYYQVGRLEAQTPLRFILSDPALKAAFWITLFGIIAFMIFEARRRQRIIPEIKPPANTSLEFVETLGRLYYTSRGDHVNLAAKRVNFFLEYVRRKYYLPTSDLDENFIKDLSLKSGKKSENVGKLIKLVNKVRGGKISPEDFLKLEKELNQFYGITPINNIR